MRTEKVADEPVPVWLIHLNDAEADWKPNVRHADLRNLDHDLLRCEFRGVTFQRLDTVLSTGIDVDPPNSPIYTSSIEKACEYGGYPKLILALALDSLERTFREIPTSAPAEEVEALRNQFPTVLTSQDGEWLWMSRLSENDRRISSSYEVNYARWIPGDAVKCLRGLLIFLRAEDEVSVRADLIRHGPQLRLTVTETDG